MCNDFIIKKKKKNTRGNDVIKKNSYLESYLKKTYVPMLYNVNIFTVPKDV